MVDDDIHIGSVGQVVDHLKDKENIQVKDWVVRDIMKNELDLRYSRIKQISW